MHSALRPLTYAVYAAALRRPYIPTRIISLPLQSCSSRFARFTCSGPTSSEPPSGGVNPQKPLPRLHIVFTCKKCDTRAVKSFTKQAYEKGVVLVTCPGCQARHVIADNLGWFGEDRNIEEILAKKGQTVKRVTDGDLEFSPSSVHSE